MDQSQFNISGQAKAFQTQLNTDISKRNEELEKPEALASQIWSIVEKACKELKISQATLSSSDSDIILKFPANENLNSITFSCNNKEKVLSIFSSLAENSKLEGKIYCKNIEVQLHFRY